MMKDYDYEYEHDDRYCYKDSRVLINKLHITDADILEEAERKITALRMMEATQKGIRGKFDFNHLKRIHKFLFGDIYTWAGKIRLVNISKGNQFCKVEFIEPQMEEIFGKLQKENCLKNLENQQQIGKRLAYYLGEINAIHPFREGNGRAQRLFITLLAQSLGYDLNWTEINKKDMLKASALAFDLKYDMLEDLINTALHKKK